MPTPMTTLFVLGLLVAGASPAFGQSASAAYPAMAPIAQYQSATREAEIALARSAAPPSISNEAEILVLGARGYETALSGKNGFVCIVERGWANDFDHAEFWSPKVRSPFCYNAAAARSVLPTYLKRTEWVLSGAPKAEMVKRTRAALAAKTIRPPETGSMCYMMSKDGYLNDDGGHWRPHLMYFLPRTEPALWGANLPGSPMMGTAGGLEPLTIFFAPVPNWSDGSPGPMTM